jgi:microsomal epoxide hydrolase
LSLAPVPLLAQRRRDLLRPFKVEIPPSVIDRILARVRDARWPDRLEASDWRYGANWEYLKSLAQYWTTGFDWGKAQAGLNRCPQFIAQVEDFEIHFYHVRGRGPRPLPLILTHGWPGSVFEFLEAIGPLTDPVRFGGSADDSFDVVVPSLPGFGFSSKPKGKPIGPRATARLWHQLMTGVLGYSKFGAQGGDWGLAVAIQLANQFPDALTGIHLNASTVRPAPESEQSEEERAWRRAASAFSDAEMDYYREHVHKPQTVAFALSDSPLAAAAWMIEKFKVWSDSGDDIERAFTKDQLLTNLMIYLVTDTAATGVWFYRGSAEEGPALRERVTVPTGFAAFPKEMVTLAPPRSALQRDFNLVHYAKMPRGGHFACLEQPALFVQDLRDFFRQLRA